MRPPRRALPLLAVCLTAAWGAGAAPAWCWTPAMDERVTREAVRLMPSSFRSILTTHAEALLEGAREAAAEEPAAFHALDPNQQSDSAASRLEELVPRAVSAIDDHRPFADVARLLGRIAHYAGDLNNPLQVSSDDPREDHYGAQYTAYVEKNLPKYPLVFYGWADEILDTAASPRQGVRAFADRAARRARRDYATIRAAYDPASKVPRDQRFDERSLPFGIGSLGWSRTVSDTALLWRHVWRLARGDMGGTPYLEAALQPAATAAAPSKRPASEARSKPAPVEGKPQPAADAKPKEPAVKVIRPARKPKPPEPDPNAAADANAPADPNAPAGGGGAP